MRQNCSQSIHSHLSGPDKSSNEHPTPVAMSFDGNGCWCECDMMNRIGFHAQRLMTTTKSITYFPAQIFHGCVCEVAVDLYSLSLCTLSNTHTIDTTQNRKKRRRAPESGSLYRIKTDRATMQHAPTIEECDIETMATANHHSTMVTTAVAADASRECQPWPRQQLLILNFIMEGI